MIYQSDYASKIFGGNKIEKRENIYYLLKKKRKKIVVG
jgi:hypothetical protein